jgi:salicylate hydroxylase
MRVLRDDVTPDYVPLYGAPWMLFHRVDLHNELKRMATKPRPSTTSVAQVHLLCEVVDIDLDGHVTLANGQKLKKDLVVVADGVHVGVPLFTWQLALTYL